MSAIYLDGFDHYGPGAGGKGNMLDGSWAEVQSGDSGPAVPSFGTRTGLYALKGATFGASFRYVLPATVGRLFSSCGFAADGLPTVDFRNSVVTFCTASNVTIATLWCQSNGALVLERSGSVIAATQGPVIVSRSWHFLEWDFDQAAGKFTLRIDDPTGSDTPAIAATGLDLGGAGVGQLHVLDFAVGSFGFTVPWMDDLFIRDTSGSVNNSWLGDRRIAALFANADTTTSGWTPSYYHEFGPGILTLGFVVPNDTSVHNNNSALTTPAASSLDIGSADFTLETEIRFDKLPVAGEYSSVFNRWDANNNLRSYRLIYGGSSFNNNCLQFDTSTDGTAATIETMIEYPWVPALNTWYHLALCRSAGELLLFVDGQQLGLPITDGNTYFTGGSEVLSVGGEAFNGTTIRTGTTLPGRLDETRFTNGIGRYTGPFTPPTMAFPRGLTDPDWTSVVLLMGYDSGITDESSYVRTVSAQNGAVSFIPSDGPDVGVYSTVNKATPDDNTFISASLVNATNILTMTTQPANGNTVTVGTTDGMTDAVYTFVTSVSVAFDVLIDTTAQNTLTNLLNAINAGAGSGTKYGTGTTSNFDVNAIQLPPGQIEVVSNTAGTAGNSIASTATGSAASWATTTLTGGSDIPGPTDFLFQRPPNNTTIISALQTNIRALKTDAGSATIQTAFIGALGGVATGSTHSLSISPTYYKDILEQDPDTSGPLSPTAIINGKFEINRTA